MKNLKRQRFLQRKNRTAKRIGNSDLPRLSVFRSNKYIFAQIIDDKKGVTLVSASSKEAKDTKTKLENSESVGTILAKKAIAKKINKVKFDKSGYKYHGRVAILAGAARKAGLVI